MGGEFFLLGGLFDREDGHVKENFLGRGEEDQPISKMVKIRDS